ncbi:MAG: hypothetical protein H7Y18_11575 [Clostridiaceae bacterium]|nr:hypothetical protein [Clostridiaceae bacterium]
MIFKDVVDKSNFDDVYNYLVKNDAKVKTVGIDRVKRGYEDIKFLSYKDNEDGFTIVIELVEEDGEKYYNVSGLKSDEDVFYSLMYTDWEEWLGFEVDEQLINTMNFSKITAHCFWEMTWRGWTKEELEYNLAIQEKGKEIQESINELKLKNKLIEDNVLEDIIIQYKHAETDKLKIDIEVAIEELIESSLIAEQQAKYIVENFDDEDILEAIKKHWNLII